jgi:hypothetical protein
LSATLRYHQRKHLRKTAILINAIESLFEENKALMGENKSDQVASVTKAAHHANQRANYWEVVYATVSICPTLAPTEILFRPGNPPLFGSAINEYGTNKGSSLVANL